ncbi:hypothetical protein [Hirschia baltica]|uniref:hypothetical protein n=1 Tax=Hirschia baltica TaxID=2724 RepID=UPI00059BFBD3|nr:hypothetical protein [Hirschia baltica]
MKSGLLGALGGLGGGTAATLGTKFVSGGLRHSVQGKKCLNVATSKRWNAVSQRTRRAQNIPSSNDLHHWAIPRNDWGKHVSNSIKNHPFNLNSIPKPIHHSIHSKFNFYKRLGAGVPKSFQAGSATGDVFGGASGE